MISKSCTFAFFASQILMYRIYMQILYIAEVEKGAPTFWRF